MDIYLLFRKKTPLTEEGLPWLFPLVILREGQHRLAWDGVQDDDQMLYPGIRRLERAGITFIGVYLGEDADLAAKLKRLFPERRSLPSLIISSNNDLPDKLGNLLMVLA